MRFFKIFLIVFFSLIGVFGATYGILLAVGYFDQEKVAPENIYFEQSVYNEVGAMDSDGDISFNMTVQTSTADVTEKSVTLSFKNQTLPVTNGRISNGIISIPERVNIGEPFKVIVTQEYLEATGGNWNKGGTSTIVARTDIVSVTQAETTINIDVPVYSIDVVAKSNGTETNTFSVNSTFTVEPVFTPASSQYMFGGTEAKSVYYAFTTAQGNVNSYIEDLGFIEGKRTFRALMPTDGPITITAYVFNNSQIELENEAQFTEEEDLITQASNSTLGKSANINVNFVTQTISGFEISQTNGSQLPFNRTSIIYANSSNDNENSLGIRVLATDQSVDMAYKLSEVGIRIIFQEGARGNEVAIVGYGSMVGVTPEGDVVYGNDIDPDQDMVYYLPNANLTDMNRSYWTLAVNNPNTYFNIEVRIFGSDEEFSEGFEEIDKVKQTPYWSTAGVVSTSLTWKDENPVTLTYEDALEPEDIVHRSYNLFNNINITQGSYTTIKYIAYTTVADENIYNMISGLIPAGESLFNFDSLFQSYGLGSYSSYAEIEDISGEFETLGTGTFNVIAVVIQTDYLGAPILDASGYYQIVTIVKNQDNPLSNQPLEFVITKTLKTLSAHAIVDQTTLDTVTAGLTTVDLANYNLNYTLDGIKNATASNNNEIYAFKYNSTGLPSFVMEIRFSAGDESIFIDAWNNNDITIQFTNVLTSLQTSVITYQKVNISSGNIRTLDENTRAIYVPFIVRNVSQDIELKFELLYQKTENKIEPISSVDYGNPALSKNFEVYDGNPARIIFGQTEGQGIQTSEDSRIQKSIEILGDTQVDVESDHRYIAESITTAYSLAGFTGDIEEELFSANGKFNVIVFDKYNVVLLDDVDGTGIVNSAITSDSVNGNYTVSVQTSTKSSSLTENPSATLYFHESQGGYVSRIEYYTDIDEQITENRVDKTFDIEDQYNPSSEVVNMRVLGVTNKNISLTGPNSIFRITYHLNDRDYVLYNVTSFEATDINNYQDWLAFNANSTQLQVRQNFGNTLSFNLTASVPELFLEQTIGFTISPAIVLTDSAISPVQAGAESVGENPIYRGVYSNNQITVTLNFENSAYVSGGALKVVDENGEAFDTALSTASLSDNGTELTLNFGADKLGEQVVTLYTGNDPNNVGFGFKQNLYFNVTPNVSVDSTGYTVESDGTINLGTYYLNGATGTNEERIEVYSVNDTALFNLIKRIDTAGDLIGDFSNINLSFSATEVSVSENSQTFGIDNNSQGAYLQINSTILDTQTLELYVLYGTEGNYTTIAKIKLDISANVAQPNIELNRYPITTANDEADPTALENITHNAFANYNRASDADVLHLVLVSGYRYNYSDILGLFSNADGSLTNETNAGKYSISFTNNINYVLDDTAGTITVNSSILNVNQSTFKIVQEGVAEITFNVLIIPGSYEFVKYNTSNDEKQTADYENLINKVNKNIYLLNDVQYLQDEEVYDSYNGGKTHKLYDLFDEAGYGISREYGNKTNFSFRIVNEDGTSNPNAYATFNSLTGVLTTYTYGSEKFIRIICYSGADQTTIFNYRIKVVPNADLNVYYPYIYGANPTGSGVAEYLDFTSNTDIHLDLNTAFEEKIPNYREDEEGEPVGRRFALQSLEDDGTYIDVETSYTLKYSIVSLEVGNIPVTGNNISGFVTLSESGELVVYYVQGTMLTIVINAEAYLGENSLGASAEYTIIVGYNYETYDFRLPNEITTQYTTSSIEKTAEDGYELDLANEVALVSIQGGVATRSNLLNFYYYDVSENGKDKLIFNTERNVISLVDPEISLVSDITFKVVLYTRYGENVSSAYRVLNVTFKSNIEANLNPIDYVLYYDSAKNEYYTYSDRILDLKDEAGLLTLLQGNESGEDEDIFSSIDWANSTLDVRLNGEIPAVGYQISMNADGDITLPQLTASRTYDITLNLALNGMTEKYVYTFRLTVYPNVSTKFNESNYYELSAPIPANEERDVIAIQEFATPVGNDALVASDNALFSVITDGTNYYSGTALGVFVEEGTNAVVASVGYFNTDGEQVEGDAIDQTCIPKLIVQTQPVADVTPVVIHVTITVNGIVYHAYVSFEVEPDTVVTINYPTASGEARTAEYIYLPVGTTDSPITYNINFTQSGLISTQTRVTVTDGEETITANSDRVRIILGGTNWQRYITATGLDENNALSGTSTTLSWNTDGTSSINSIDLSFIIEVDGIERDTYVVRLDKNLGNVYSYEINYFGDTEVSGDGTTSEIFILTADKDAIFSTDYQLLSFLGKSTLSDNTVISAKDIAGGKAQISIDNGATFSDSVTIGSEFRNSRVDLILRFTNLTTKPDERIDPYASSTSTNSFDYYFSISGGQLFSDIATVGTSEVKTRISLYYRGDLVDYSKYANVLYATQGASGTMSSITLDLSTATNSTSVIFNLFDYLTQPFITYSYKAVFDFKIGSGKTVSQGFMETLEANDSSIGILGVSGDNNIWDITKYNGEDYPRDYFATENNRNINISLFMVTTLDYDYTQFEAQLSAYEANPDDDATAFPATGSGDSYQVRYLALRTLDSPYNYPPARITPLQANAGTANAYTYDFNIMADGAENEGNYVIYKVTYTVKIGDTDAQPKDEYIMIKVLPDWEYSLNNGEGSATTQNSESTPLYIYYEGKMGVGSSDSQVELPFAIARSGDSSRVVLKHTNGSNTSNQATAFTYTLSSNLQNYISMASTGNNIVQFQRGALTAHYGDIEGYIDITDVFGYTLRYYVVLVAFESSTRISQIIDSEGAQVQGNEIWEGSSIYIIDYDHYINTLSTSAERLAYLSNIGADYYVLISGYNQTFGGTSVPPTATFRALSNGVNSNSLDKVSNSDQEAKFKVMNASFYAGALSVPLTLEITFNVSLQSGTTEEILIYTTIYLKQRYAVTISSADSNNVLDNQTFDVAKFISISDRKEGNNLGTASLGSYDYSLDLSGVNLESGTLEVTMEIKRANTVSVTGTLSIPSSELNGEENQYFFLSDFSNFESIDFSQYDLSSSETYMRVTSLSITGATNDNNTALMFAYTETARTGTSLKIVALNPTTKNLSLQLTTNAPVATTTGSGGGATTTVNNESVTFVYGSTSDGVITYRTIASSRASSRLEFNATNFTPVGLAENEAIHESFTYLPTEFTLDYLFPATSGGYETNEDLELDITDKIFRDKKIMLNSMDVGNEESPKRADFIDTASGVFKKEEYDKAVADYLKIYQDNATYNVDVNISTAYGVKQVNFLLNYDGTQTKSLRFELLNEEGNGIDDSNINNVWSFTLSDMPLTSQDQLDAKATDIYTDTISLLIPAGFVETSGARVPLSISVETGGETLTTTPYTLYVTEMYSHYIHIPLTTIIDQTTLEESDINAKYKITITYTRNSEIKYQAIGEESSNYTYDQTARQSTLTIEKFKITELSSIPADDIASGDLLDIKSVDQFNMSTKTSRTNIFKGYVTKFAKSDLYNSNSIGYTVTPNPYGVDTNGNSGTLRYKQIDAAACNPTVVNGSTIYTIPASRWTENFQVVGRSGDIISLLSTYFNNGENQRIFFEINTDDEVSGYGAGLATIDEEGTITTDASFDITTNAIVVSVRAYVDYTDGGSADKQNSIEVGTVAIVLTENTLTAPSVGNYTIQRKATELDSEGNEIQTIYENINYTVETPNDRVIQVYGLFPEREKTEENSVWQYNYTLVELFQNTTLISANVDDTSKLDIFLRTINDRTTLKNQKIVTNIQAVSRTTGEIKTSEDITFSFDANGYTLELGTLSNTNVFTPFDESYGVEVDEDETKIANYQYDITINLQSIFTGEDEIITGLNYEYRLIIKNYSTIAGENIQIDDMVISDDASSAIQTNHIIVFKVDAYGQKGGEDNVLLGSKYIGYISYSPITAGGVVLDLRSAFENEEYYNSTTGQGRINRYETSQTGLVLPIFDDTFADIGAPSDGTDEESYSSFITPSVDSGNRETGKNHSWLLKAVSTTSTTGYTKAYYNLINVNLKYRQSFVIEGTGDFYNSLSPEVSGQAGVNIDDLKTYLQTRSSTYNYELVENVAYTTINPTSEEDTNEYSCPDHIVNVKYTSIEPFSFYRIEYLGTSGSLNVGNYAVKNDGTTSNFNLETITLNTNQEIALTEYHGVTTKLSELTNNTYYLFDETYSGGTKKAQFIQVTASYPAENSNMYMFTSTSSFLSALDRNSPNTNLGISSVVYRGTSIDVENGLYSLHVVPSWDQEYYYYFYADEGSPNNTIQLQMFTPTGSPEDETGNFLGNQTVEALYSGGYSYIYRLNSDATTEMSDGSNFIFLAESERESLIEFKSLTAHEAKLSDSSLGWYYLTGLQGQNISYDVSEMTHFEASEAWEITLPYGSGMYFYEDENSQRQYLYLSSDKIDLKMVYYSGSSFAYRNGTLTKVRNVSWAVPTGYSSNLAMMVNNSIDTAKVVDIVSITSGDFSSYGYRLNISNLSLTDSLQITSNLSLDAGYYTISGSETRYIYVKSDDSFTLSSLFTSANAGNSYTVGLQSDVTNLVALDSGSLGNYVFFKDNNESDETRLVYNFVQITSTSNGYVELSGNITNCDIVGINNPTVTLPELGTYKIVQEGGEEIEYTADSAGELSLNLATQFAGFNFTNGTNCVEYTITKIS